MSSELGRYSLHKDPPKEFYLCQIAATCDKIISVIEYSKTISEIKERAGKWCPDGLDAAELVRLADSKKRYVRTLIIYRR